MAITIIQKDPGPHPTTPITITPPAYDPADTRDAQARWVDQQWRDAAKAGLGAQHPLAVNPNAGHTS